MARSDEDGDSMPGQDSFIDVICNMVGILIILVMVVGARVSSAPVEQILGEIESRTRAGAHLPSTDPPSTGGSDAPAESEPTRTELDAVLRQAADARHEIETAIAHAIDDRRQSALVDAQRDALAEIRAVAEQEIDQRRAQLDAAGQREFDVQRQIAAAQIELNEITHQKLALIDKPAKVEAVECVPTPLAKTVTGDEIHIRLKHSQLAVVPVDELLNEVSARGGDYIRSGLNSRNAANDSYGPVGGFRLRLSVERVEQAALSAGMPNMPKRSALVLQGVFTPNVDDIGQTIEQALLPDGVLFRAIRARRAANTAVTAWVYPDSYAALRTLKRTLWEAGVPLAVRPLSDGQPIVFSTLGTKSAAE